MSCVPMQESRSLKMIFSSSSRYFRRIASQHGAMISGSLFTCFEQQIWFMSFELKEPFYLFLAVYNCTTFRNQLIDMFVAPALDVFDCSFHLYLPTVGFVLFQCVLLCISRMLLYDFDSCLLMLLFLIGVVSLVMLIGRHLNLSTRWFCFFDKIGQAAAIL